MKRKPAHAQVAEIPAPYGQPGSDIVLYRTDDGKTDVKVRLGRESVWLTQRQMASLFGVHKPAISKHLKNIYAAGELLEDATVSKMETVQTEGQRTVRRLVEYYNLDATISVGYRVNSIQATQFRIWATGVLREHILQGYTINRRRLQQLHQAIRLVATVADPKERNAAYRCRWLSVVDASRYQSTPIDTSRWLSMTLDGSRLFWQTHFKMRQDILATIETMNFRN